MFDKYLKKYLLGEKNLLRIFSDELFLVQFLTKLERVQLLKTISKDAVFEKISLMRNQSFLKELLAAVF